MMMMIMMMMLCVTLFYLSHNFLEYILGLLLGVRGCGCVCVGRMMRCGGTDGRMVGTAYLYRK